MARIPDETREAIADELREGKASVRAIATKHGVAASTVSRIADTIGVEPAQRAMTENARQANIADYAERRARIRAQLAVDAEEEQRRLWAPVTIGKFGGKDGDWSQVDLPEPPPDVRRDIWTNLAIAVDKMAVMDRADQGTSEAAGLVEELVLSIRERRQTRPEQESA
jgi:transposase-like protein